MYCQGAGTAVRSTAGLTAPTVSCLTQIQHSQLQKCVPKVAQVHQTGQDSCLYDDTDDSLKADSHIACCAHAVLLIYTCHAAPLPCSGSAVSFVKVRMVAGNIRTVRQTV
jgi:hypothetical protein